MAALPSTRNSAMSSQEAPLLLCQICQSWRSIAFATPRLWAAIHIVIPDQSRIQLLTDRLIFWLKRSGVVPLHISLVSSRTSEPNGDFSPLLEALTAVSRRWRNIELSWPGNMHARSRLIAVTSADVPLLETIKINYLEDSTIGSQTFLATKSLRSLTFPAIDNCQDVSVSWHHLRYLKITSSWHGFLTCPAALQILQQCTALQTCEFAVTDTGADLDGSVSKAEFSLPELLHLSISRGNPIHGSHFFGIVSLPNLQSLYYYESRGGNQSTDLELVRLLPSTPTLQCFTIHIRGLQSASLLKVLACMPNLRELVIWEEPCKDTGISAWPPSMDEKFLEHLTLSPGSNSVVCPLLESIQFQNFSAASDETLLQFVQSRTAHQLPCVGYLSRVVASFNRPMHVDILLHLQDAVSRGLEISLNYPASSPGNSARIYSPLEGTNDGWDWAADSWGQNW
ncbi:hypothetical protein MVEN_01159600 [Mycena venus]|uniref:F-box domain-containing protein n=1 Tax=Mycena venus TaxID=2733690 RepID=A0A8H6Y0V0_9AGAR|nr:hypothetical protein MVEN_01159600 [Mycena venus]